MTDEILTTKDWPHAPIHRLVSAGIFMVTAATLYKRHLFRGAERLSLLENALLSLAKQYQWQLEAWSVFSNHYHFVGRKNLDSVEPELFSNSFMATQPENSIGWTARLVGKFGLTSGIPN